MPFLIPYLGGVIGVIVYQVNHYSSLIITVINSYTKALLLLLALYCGHADGGSGDQESPIHKSEQMVKKATFLTLGQRDRRKNDLVEENETGRRISFTESDGI